jgi:hypothetical protein
MIVLPLLLVVPIWPVLAGPPEATGRDFGKAKVEIPVPSKWVMVRGWQGDTPVTEGSVTFKEGNKVEARWKKWRGRGSSDSALFCDYQLDPRSGLPVIPDRLLKWGTFRLVGSHFEFKMGGPLLSDSKEPFGDLLLLLKLGEE